MRRPLRADHVHPGDTIEAVGVDFDPGQSSDILLDRTVLVTAVADDQGQFDIHLVVPASLTPGRHELENTCVDLGIAGGTQIEVLGTTVTTSGPRPATGSNDTLPLSRIAFGLISFGTLLLVTARRRTLRLTNR